MADKRSKRRKRPTVISRHGRYRFQTGMVTAGLLQRGLDMADAFAISNDLRDQIEPLDEISADELESRTRALVVERLGITEDEFPSRQQPVLETGSPLVRVGGRALPFSRGVLLRQLITTGLRMEDAMVMAEDINRWLIGQGTTEVSELDIEDAVCERLRDIKDERHVRRYRFSSWVRRTDVPLFILLGGATGTGKSTLATELAFRLGIRMVTSTDMIRETMRTVLSPEVVPGLHDHSFRGMLQGGKVLSKPRERVLAGYRQQSAQVAVGIRAVIRRAMRENTHMIIEGTHLLPPFNRYVPMGSETMVAGLVLAVPEEKRHQQRFPSRARGQTMRNPDTYLEAFQSVRWIHDDLLSAAEDADSVVVANDDLDITVHGVIDYLSQALPWEDGPTAHIIRSSRPPRPTGPRTLFLILDGLADEPNPALDGATPLSAAHTPILSALAGRGGQGRILTTHDPNKAAATNEGLLALLGQPEASTRIGRGLLEALGKGVPLAPGAVFFRGNLATMESDGTLADRRAGRIRAGVEDMLVDLQGVSLPGGITGRIMAGHEHRVLVMLQGRGLSAAVSDTDPGSEAIVQRVLAPEPLDDSPEAARTVDALKALLAQANTILEAHPLNDSRQERGLFRANAIITRGAARVDDLPAPRHTPNQAALISACPTALGVARTVGMEAATAAEMTGNLDTNLDVKFGAAADLFADRHFVAIHFKGTDIAAHDRRPLEKRDFISLIDEALGRFLHDNPELSDDLRVVVTADHGTSCITGNHMADPVPLLVANWSEEGEPEAFDEDSAQHGALGLIQPGELSAMLFPEDAAFEGEA